ncbi:MAG: methylmalonyl Co-A mutase-associated GTPase MeaB [Candidatus Thermoplasmatota archaeon]|nr:methylmalonyl Co-A mutase-associated GTPase MeaB [Candidatus Thermoplasmatota archaeon]
MEIVSELLSGDRRALARLISMVENLEPGAKKALSELYSYTGNAHVIGITGPPGSGKSTVVDKLTLELLDEGKSVGIIAVDPTSPFTGGALLGDRVRMNEVSLDEDVFIRSMGTRGHLGGLATKTRDVIKILDAFGKDFILVETVGAGQSEVEVVKAAHTTIIVEVPGLGDDIQAIKAGILEIGDIFIVNKADRDGADNTARELDTMLGMNQEEKDWEPPILKTVAKEGKNIDELNDAISSHLSHLKETGGFEELKKKQIRDEFLDIVREKIYSYTMERTAEGKIDEIVENVMNSEIDPYSAAEDFLEPLEEDRKD